MGNLKNYLPVIVFAVTLVLSGISIITSNELAKRKYIPPLPTQAEGCTQEQVDNGTCHWADSIGLGKPWVYQEDPISKQMKWFSPQEAPDPSAREEAPAPPPPPTSPPPPPPTNTPTPTSTPTKTPTPTPTPTPTVTPTKTPTPTATPTGTLTPTATSTVTPTGTPLPTLTPTSTPTGTLTPTITPSPTQVAAAHKACVNLTCQVVTGSGPDTCQSDVSCQPPPITPVTPKAATITPTILSIIGGVGLLLIGILLSL